jgi:hypothetical protein
MYEFNIYLSNPIRLRIHPSDTLTNKILLVIKRIYNPDTLSILTKIGRYVSGVPPPKVYS